EQGMKGQFSRWPAPSNGQVRQDKFLELLKAQFRRNLPPARTFRHFRPPKRGACLESGVRARIQRFQHPTAGSDLAENPQRVAYVSVGSLLTNSGLILKPDLYWCCGRGAEKCRPGQAGKTSFKYHLGLWILLGMHRSGLQACQTRPMWSCRSA